MVKSKKKLNNVKRHSIKSRKIQKGGQSFTSFGDFRYGSETVQGSLKSIEKLQDTTKQASLIISSLEAPKWGTSKGASSYTKIKGNLLSIRHSNIEAMEKIQKTLDNPSKDVQRTVIKLIQSLGNKTNGSRYQKILQNKRDINSSFTDVSTPKKADKSQVFNTVSERVHITRKNVLLDITTLVRTENLTLNGMLSTVLTNKGQTSFSRNTDSSQ